MTVYHMTERALRAEAPWTGTGDDRAYHDEPHANDARSVYSGVRRIVQSVGLCKTPHIGNAPRKLVNGWCAVCRANGAGQ